MKDSKNRNPGQSSGNSGRKAPASWEESSRWFEERQSRITTGSYSQSQQNSYEGRSTTQKPQNNTAGRNKPSSARKAPVKKKKASPSGGKSRNEKENKRFNRYYNKNKNSGKSKDELRKEFALHAKRRRKRKVAEALCFTFLIAVGVFVALSLTVLFKIETINVTGDTRYSQEQVIEAAQVKAGDNLWLTTSDKLTENAAVALPYIKSVKVKRSVPSEITLEVTETVPEYSIKNNKKYVLIDESGKVLETVAKKKGSTTEIIGVECGNFEAGLPLNVVSQYSYELAMEIISYTDELKISLNQIDVSNVNLITAVYNSRLRLEFGAGTDLETKVKMAKEIIKKLKEENNTQEGVINLKSVTQAFFREEALNPTQEQTTLPTSDTTSDTTDSSGTTASDTADAGTTAQDTTAA